MSYRFSSQPFIEQTWNVTSNEVTALINTSSKAEISKLLGGLIMGSDKLAVRYEDANGSDYDVAFSLNGSRSALKGIKDYCPKAFE